MFWGLLFTGLFTVGAIALLAWSAGRSAENCNHIQHDVEQMQRRCHEHYQAFQTRWTDLAAVQAELETLRLAHRRLSGQFHAAKRWDPEPEGDAHKLPLRPACTCGWCEACTTRKLAEAANGQ